MPNNLVKNQEQEKKWDVAKEKTKNEHPEFKEGSDQFYKYTVSIYKNLTKSASGEDIINNLKAEGVISKNAVDKYREETQYVNIVSKLFTPQEEKVADSDYMKNVGVGVLTGLGVAGAGYGIASASKGIQKYLAKKKRPERLKDIIKFAPIVREMDPALVQEGMKTLENYNPEMAKHPLIAGSFLKSIHNYGGITPEQANILKGDSYGKDMVKTIGDSVGNSGRFSPGLGDLTKAHDILKTPGNKDEENVKDRIRAKILKKVSSDETKEAGVLDSAKTVGKGALTAGLAVAGLAGVGKAGSVVYNKLTREGRINAVKQFSPSLKKADPKLLNAGMKTLERLSPQVSKDPLAAGGFLKQIIKGKGLKPAGVKDIVDTSNREDQTNPFVSAGRILSKDI